MAGLVLNADSGTGGSQSDSVDLSLRQRNFKEPDIGSIGCLRRGALPVNESLELLLCSIASAFFITRSIGAFLRGIVPCLDHFAGQQAAASASRCDQGIAFAESAAKERTASHTDCITDNSGWTDTCAASKEHAGEK